MAEPRFIKTVTFGGYEKEAVIRRMEFLNTQVHDLRNELRETKLLLEAYKKGTEQEKSFESVLSEERAKLTQVQVQNNTLNLKLKATDDENRTYEQDIKNYQAEIAELQDKLKAAESKCAALMAQDEAMALSNVFIEAQKSSAMLETAAKTKAADIEHKTKKLAEKIVYDHYKYLCDKLHKHFTKPQLINRHHHENDLKNARNKPCRIELSPVSAYRRRFCCFP